MLFTKYTLYLFSPDYVLPTWFSDTHRTKALVFISFVPLKQELVVPDPKLYLVLQQYLLWTLVLQSTIFILVSLLLNSFSIAFKNKLLSYQRYSASYLQSSNSTLVQFHKLQVLYTVFALTSLDLIDIYYDLLAYILSWINWYFYFQVWESHHGCSHLVPLLWPYLYLSFP